MPLYIFYQRVREVTLLASLQTTQNSSKVWHQTKMQQQNVFRFDFSSTTSEKKELISNLCLDIHSSTHFHVVCKSHQFKAWVIAISNLISWKLFLYICYEYVHGFCVLGRHFTLHLLSKLFRKYCLKRFFKINWNLRRHLSSLCWHFAASLLIFRGLWTVKWLLALVCCCCGLNLSVAMQGTSYVASLRRLSLDDF